MNNKHYWLLLCSLFFALQAFGATELDAGPVDNDDFAPPRIIFNSWLGTDQDVIVTQQLELYIEVATKSWFTKGTEIGRFEIDGAAILRREKFAVNSSKQIDGEQWTVQQWVIAIYPQRPGNFVIPPIDVEVSVSENHQPVEQSFQTEELSFSAVLPEGVEKSEQFFAAPEFTIEETFSRDFSDTGLTLNTGDSLQRKVVLTASGVAAMMLPALNFDSSDFNSGGKSDGLAIYQDSPVLKDKESRGVYLAQRIESVTYMVEGEGSFVLPAIDITWWNSVTNSMQTETLEARLISTSALTDEFNEKTLAENQNRMSLWKDHWQTIVLTVVVILFVILAWFKLSNTQLYTNLLSKYKLSRRQAVLEKSYQSACSAQDYVQASRCLLKWFELQPVAKHSESLRQWLKESDNHRLQESFNDLMAMSYQAEQKITADQAAAVGSLMDKLKLILKQNPVSAGLHHNELRLN